MVRRSTWILLIIFIALAGAVYFFQRYQTQKTDNAATATPSATPVKVYNQSGAQVEDIKISDSSGKALELYKDQASSKWAVANVPVEKADSFQIESVSAQLFDLQAQETLTQTPPLDSVGLITPTYTITMTTTGGSQTITSVGSQTPTGSGYYIRVNAGQVIIVDKLILDDILHLLSNPPLLATPTPEVTPTETISPTNSGTKGTPMP
jgi:Domain of unknown function (DUF4340)